MIWEKHAIDPEEVKELATLYNIDLLPAAIMARRNITVAQELRYYLEDGTQYLHNPFLLEEMEDAVERIFTAKSEGEKVLVYGDRDVDGITSIVLLVETLKDLGLDVSWKLPMGDDPYGLTMEVVEEFARADGTLIIAVDCGTTNTREISFAQELGVDTIVVDHHNPQEELPAACAIINPKLSDTGYPFAGLCGCGVAAKLRWALYFGNTDFYKQPICLLNVRPGNETFILDAVKLENLIEIDRMSESLVPGMMKLEETQFAKFVRGQQVLVYDAPAQEQMLRKLFGNRVEINVLDLAPEVWDMFPALENRSLLKMSEGSRLARYGTVIPEEIDAFVALFTAFVNKKAPELEEKNEAVMDLVALGTLADMMPLRNENRILVKRGLARLTAGKRLGVRTLLEKQKLFGKAALTSRDIGFQLAPVINASGRMGEPDKSVRLLLSDNPAEAEELAAAIVALNQKRRQIGEEAWSRVLPAAQESYRENGNRFILVQDNEVHRGITGILAGRLSRQFKVPAAVVTSFDGRAVGSLRSARGMGATEFLKQFEDLFDDWGGHDSAAGFQFPFSAMQQFTARARKVIPEIVLEEEEEEKITIDAELPHSHLTPELEQVVEIFAPFGQENPPLVFMARALRIGKLDLVGREEQHLRLLLDSGNYRWPAVFWNSSDRVGVDFRAGDQVDVLFEFGKNYFQNRETVQLTVIDMKRTAS